jgi:hypothetical protein
MKTLECVSMGCLNWRESRAEGWAEQKSSDLILVQVRDWLSRKRNPVRPAVSAKPIFKEGILEGKLDPHVQFQPPMETRSNRCRRSYIVADVSKRLLESSRTSPTVYVHCWQHP